MAEVKPTVIVADPKKGVKVDAAVVAKPFRQEIKDKVSAMKVEGIGTYLYNEEKKEKGKERK